ncbi:MAG: hypothetical protein ACI9YL_001668 [Luteibaculaceae bacterium]|jgi:hypothetical protein
MLTEFVNALYEQYGNGLIISVTLVGIIAIVAQWRLYSKAELPGLACLVPFWNFVIFLKMIGRPWTHMFLFLIPVYNIYLLFKIYVELCNSFGKTTLLDYILCILLNGLYIFNLGMSYDTEYKGPVYGIFKKDFLEKLFEIRKSNSNSNPQTQFA